MQRFILFLWLSIGLVVMAACGSEAGVAEPSADTPGITVSAVRANMTLPSSTGSFWMEISNQSDSDDTLLGAEVAGCGTIELHDMAMENDIMVMRQVEGGVIPIPAGETVELKQGGLHVMCIDKAAPLEEGSTVDIALQFANAGTVEVTADVVAPGDHGP